MSNVKENIKDELMLKGVELFVLIMENKTENEQKFYFNKMNMIANLYSFSLLVTILVMSYVTFAVEANKLALVLSIGFVFMWLFFKARKQSNKLKIMEMYMEESNSLRKSAQIKEAKEDEKFQIMRKHMRTLLKEIENNKKEMLSSWVD